VNKIISIVIFGLIAVNLAGCASYPLPISEPPAMVKAVGSDKNVRNTPDYQRGGLLPATQLDEAKDNLKIYADWYRQASDNLRKTDYQSSDITFGGGILAGLGGLAKSQTAAIAGAVTAGGASMLSQRYQGLVQATNYDQAADALYCMYRNLYPLNRELLETSKLDSDEHERIRKTLVPTINTRIDDVRMKLRDAQSKIVLATPDFKQLEDAIKAAQAKAGEHAVNVKDHDSNNVIDEARKVEIKADKTRESLINARPKPSPSEREYFKNSLPKMEEELTKCSAKL